MRAWRSRTSRAPRGRPSGSSWARAIAPGGACDLGADDAMARAAALCERTELLAQQLAELSRDALELARYGREAVQRDTDPAPAAPAEDA
jgi:hypothetical protein